MLDHNGNRIPIHAAVTTTDNPFDPFDQFEDWYIFDHQKGYNSLEAVARLDVSSNDWPDEDQVIAYEDAVDKWVELNLTGNLKKVTRPL